MIKSFKPSTSKDHAEVIATAEAMLSILQALANSEIPNSSYSMDDLESYFSSLVVGQNKAPQSPAFGSWRITTGDDRLPSDFRVDFIYRPTYIATATLSIGLFEHPLTTILMPGYLEALINGLQFCAGRGLKGHGYDAAKGAADAVKILSLGKVPLLLNQNPDYCPTLKRALETTTNYMKNRLSSGEFRSCWGEDQSGDFISALESFEAALIDRKTKPE